MKKIIYSLLIILTIFLSSCTDNTPSPNENNIQKEKFIGTWVCEIYNNEDKKLTDVIYEIEENSAKYYEENEKDSLIEFDEFFATEKEMFFLRKNRVIQRKEYFFNKDKLIIENKSFVKKIPA